MPGIHVHSPRIGAPEYGNMFKSELSMLRRNNSIMTTAASSKSGLPLSAEMAVTSTLPQAVS